MAILDIFRKKKKEKKPVVADSASRAVAKSKRTSFSFPPSLSAGESSVGKEEDLSSSPSRAIAKGEEENLFSSPSVAEGTLTKEAVMAGQKEEPEKFEEEKTKEKKEVYSVKSSKGEISSKTKLFNGVKKESPKLKSKNIRSSPSFRVEKAKVEKKKSSSTLPFTVARVKEVKFGQSYKVLKKPHVTEKAGDLVEKNQYIFRIFSRANKTETKKAIEDVYGVDVVSVKIINVPEKKRRLGKIQGKRPGYKKAIVKIKKGQKIEVLPR